MIKQGGVYVNGERLNEWNQRLNLAEDPLVIKIGKSVSIECAQYPY